MRMVDETSASKSQNPLKATSSRFRERLELIDNAVDWTQFDRFLRWLQQDVDSDTAFEPILLFKAMLILHWHALTAPEFDHAIEDSVAFRRFVGLKPGETGPLHASVAAFRRLLVSRDAAEDALADLRGQLSRQSILEALEGQVNDFGGTGLDELYPLASDVHQIRPPAWVSLEQKFVDFWKSSCAQAELPCLAIDAQEFAPEDLLPHLTVLRVLEEDFRFEFFGEAIAAENQNDPSGDTINAKARRNKAAYGHAGLQGELIALCRAGVSRRQPVATSAYFLNGMRNRRNLWTVLAPVVDARSGDQFLIGVSLIVHVENPNALNRSLSPAQLPTLTNDLDRFSLDTDFRALGPPEWIAIEKVFLDYWNQRRGDRKAPLTADIKLTDIAAIAPHITLITVLKDVGFQYESIGEHIQSQNEGNATGQIIGEKRARNLDEFGHAGLQDELSTVFSRAVAGLQPVGTSTYYVNSGGTRCQMWTLHAPLSDDLGEVTMLLGVTLIKRVSAN